MRHIKNEYLSEFTLRSHHNMEYYNVWCNIKEGFFDLLP